MANEKGFAEQIFAPVFGGFQSDANTLRPHKVQLSTSQNVSVAFLRLSEALAAQPGSSQSVVSAPRCQNCGRKWQKCLNGKPVRCLNSVPISVISCGPYWGKKNRGCVATVEDILGGGPGEASKGERVKVRWESGKAATYLLTPTDPQAAAQPIFNFHCLGNCYNCGLPKRSCRNGTALTSVDSIPEETVEGTGCRVEAVGSFWKEKKRGRKGKVIQIFPEGDAVLVVWDDDPVKRIRYNLISNLPHAKNVHIFNLSC